jgi:hypothetical protein
MTNTKVDIAVAYTVDSDKDAKYPERNFTKVLPEKLKRRKYDTLVLQAGCNEISNLNVKSKFTAKDVSVWEEKVRQSRTKLFNLAEESLKKEKDLKDVIIITSLPRYDPEEVDPCSIKAKLNQFGNSIYTSLWMQRGCPKNIVIQDQKLDCYGDLKQKRFGNPEAVTPDGKPWDGIHMRGRLAVRHYTNSVVKIFAAHFRQMSIDWSVSQSDNRNYHKMCPQTNYQRRNFGISPGTQRKPNYPNWQQQAQDNTNWGKNTNQFVSQQTGFGQSRGFKRNNKVRNSGYNCTHAESYYSIPVANRFQKN